MSGGSAPPPPESFQMPHQEEGANNAFSAIGGLQAMPNFPQQTYDAASGSLTPIVSQPTNYNPQNTVNAGNAITALPNEYLPFARDMFSEGFDVNGQAYGRAAHNLTEQVRASQGARGIQTSPYGAGLEDEAFGNFNIDWENERLNRMIQTMGAALPAYGQAGSQMAAGQQVAQMGPRLQGDLASQLSPMGAATYNQPQMVAQDWLNYVDRGNAAAGVEAQNYASQIQAYQAEQEANAAMYAAIGELAGSATGAAIGKWG